MSPTDLTIEILKGIRDEVRGTNARLDSTNERLDSTVKRLDSTVDRLDSTVERLDSTVDRLDRLERRQIEAEVRLSTEIGAVVGAIHEVRDLLREDRALRQQVENPTQAP